MAAPIFQLTAYELTWIVRAKDAAVLGQRVAALASKYGVGVNMIKDAVWASGMIGGHTAKTAAARAGAQALARGAARRMGEVGARSVARHAAGHAARVAGAEAVGGLGAALGGIGTFLGLGLVVLVLAGGAYAAHRIYTTNQDRRQQVDPYSPPSVIGPHVDEHGRENGGSSDLGSAGFGSVLDDHGSGGSTTLDHGPHELFGTNTQDTGPSARVGAFHGRWVLDVPATVDRLIRAGLIERRDRAVAMAEFPQKFGRPTLDIRTGGVVHVTGLRQGVRAGRWTAQGGRVTLRMTTSTQVYRIAGDRLVAEGAGGGTVYRRP